MATVPNRYYNSPWIADAGRNLAAALAPPDQEKQLAVQKEKLALQFLQEQHQQAIEDRTKRDAGYAALGRIFNAPDALPEAKSPGEAAYQASQYPNGVPTGPNPEDIQAVIGSGVPLGDLMSALGTESPLYKQKVGLAGLTADARTNALLANITSRELIAANAEKGRSDRNEQTDARIRELATANEKLQRDLEAMRQTGANNRAEARLGLSGNPKPINISPDAHNALEKGQRQWFTSQKLPQPPKPVFDALMQRTLGFYEEGYNDAPERARADIFGQNPTIDPAYEPWGPDLGRTPRPASIHLRGDMELGDLLAMLQPVGQGVAQPAAAAAAAAPQAAPAPAAQAPAGAPGGPTPDKLSKLQEGHVTTFSDGESWTLMNGQPMKLDPRMVEMLKGAQGGG